MNQSDLFVTFKSPRGAAKVRNTPDKIAGFRKAQAKCPGWNGKKIPTPRAGKPSGATYQHYALGFKLFIADRTAWVNKSYDRLFDYQIGNVTLKLCPKTRTITGDVPASWLVDLEADCVEEQVAA